MITLHVAGGCVLMTPVGSYSWHMGNVFDSCVRFCVPVFVMISGALFLPRDNSMKRYVVRIVGSLIFWGLLYMVVLYGVPWRTGIINLPLMVRFFFRPIHFWFMYMIAGLYLVTPILRAIVRDENAVRWFIVLWLVFTIILPSLDCIPWVGYVTKIIRVNTQLSVATNYAGYYVLGYLLARAHHPILERTGLILALIGMLATIILTWKLSNDEGAFNETYYANLKLPVFIASLGVFLTFKHMFERIRLSRAGQIFVNLIAVNSLGIYLIHMIFLEWLFDYSGTRVFESPLLYIPMLTLAILLLSIVGVMLIKLVPWLRRVV
ncbi:MAG: acyltransferase family protein [Candidatus Amulumruptor caecigallinarius]|nr:acyltransferase family protein [Candidatus Amulumruptor caecigallinarius]MCM1397577.1 acyltransferase family protein [Candidatus Amulumruptor caecigallinarius]